MREEQSHKSHKFLFGKTPLYVMLILAVLFAAAFGAVGNFSSLYANAESGVGIGNIIDFAGGDGSEAMPFLIAAATHLDNVRNYIYNKDTYDPSDPLATEGYYFKLIEDIDLSGYIEQNYPVGGWEPIAGKYFDGYDEENFPFYGDFDGCGHTINGLWSNRGDDLAGLFGAATARFCGLNIILGDKGVTGKLYVGGLAAYLISGKVSQCRIAGTVSLNGSEEDFFGTNACGGIAGVADDTEISESYFIGVLRNKPDETDGADTDAMGGIVGTVWNSEVLNSYAKVEIVTDENNASRFAGGIIGTGDDSVTVMNCYAVVIAEKQVAPVIVGANEGFFVGSIHLTALFNYYNADIDINSDAVTSAGITGLSASDMKKAASYIGWDINGADSVWGIYEGGGTPYLKCFDNFMLITPVGKPYDGKASVPAAASAGGKASKQISDTDIQVLTDCSNMIDAGTYDVKISCSAELDFYYQISVAPYVISKAVLTVKAKDITRAYGKDTPDFGYEIKSEINESDYVDVKAVLDTIVYNAPQNPKRGTYTIEISGDGLYAANYKFAFEDGDLTITGLYPYETALIVSGAAAALALAALSVVWFGIKRKSFADLGRGIKGIFIKEKTIIKTETVIETQTVEVPIEVIKEVPIVKKPLPADLSERECRVAELVLKGKSRREIADGLKISEGAVRTYAARIYSKAGVDGQKEFIARYLGGE